MDFGGLNLSVSLAPTSLSTCALEGPHFQSNLKSKYQLDPPAVM